MSTYTVYWLPQYDADVSAGHICKQFASEEEASHFAFILQSTSGASGNYVVKEIGNKPN